MKELVIIKNTGANFASLVFALERLKWRAIVTNDIEVIQQASHVILPGVGSARFAMENLGILSEVVCNLMQPVLGICLGMQLLSEYSEEGSVACLGIIPGCVKKLAGPNLIVPHMGWQNFYKKKEDPILEGVGEEDMYYVHSYALEVSDWTLASCNYGDEWSAVVKKENFYGVQFHPEKSGQSGMKILKNFLEQ